MAFIHVQSDYSDWVNGIMQFRNNWWVVYQVLSYPTIPCTGCPMHIQIPDLFVAYNSQKNYGENVRYKITSLLQDVSQEFDI